MPKVSVIVPVYNVDKYVAKCLDSLVNQTIDDYELIIINDGSTDKSEEIVQEYINKYPKLIKYIKQTNQGLSDSRNNGLKLATADYVMFVDSDDYVCNNILEKMYNKIVEEKCDCVICGNNVVKEDYTVISSTYPNNYSKMDFITKMLLGNLCAWNKIIRKEVLEDSDFLFRSRVWYEDIDFSFKLFIKSKKMCFLEENLYNYLLRDGSIMNSKNLTRNLELLEAFDEIIKYSKKHNVYEKYYKEIEFLAINHIYISCCVRILCNSSATNNEKEKLLNQFMEYMNRNFSGYSKNIYIKNLSNNRKIIYYLMRLKLYGIIKLIFKIKK